MAFYKQDIVDINLNTGSIFRSFLNHSIGFKNDDADRFGIRCFRDGEPVDLTGASCQAVFMAPNGVNIALTSYGTVSGNVAYVTLPPACYDYEGQFCLSIQLVGGGVTGTMRIVDGMVVNTGASGAVAPTASVPTYQEIIAQYDAMVAATSAANLAIAETFDATKAYPAGKYVINDGHLYRLTADHAANVTWANTSKVATNFGDDLSSLKSAFNSIGSELDGYSKFENTGTLTNNYVFLTFERGSMNYSTGALEESKKIVRTTQNIGRSGDYYINNAGSPNYAWLAIAFDANGNCLGNTASWNASASTKFTFTEGYSYRFLVKEMHDADVLPTDVSGLFVVYKIDNYADLNQTEDTELIQNILNIGKITNDGTDTARGLTGEIIGNDSYMKVKYDSDLTICLRVKKNGSVYIPFSWSSSVLPHECTLFIESGKTYSFLIKKNNNGQIDPNELYSKIIVSYVRKKSYNFYNHFFTNSKKDDTVLDFTRLSNVETINGIPGRSILIIHPSDIETVINEYDGNGDIVGSFVWTFAETLFTERRMREGYTYDIAVRYLNNSQINPLDADIDVYIIDTPNRKYNNNNNIIDIAHQGYSLTSEYYGNGRLSSFYGAYIYGFDMGECDIAWSSENIPVCCHDLTFTDRTTQEVITIANETVAQLKTHNYCGATIATFEEVLSACKMLGLGLLIDHIGTQVTDTQLNNIFAIVDKYQMHRNVWWNIGETDGVLSAKVLQWDKYATIVLSVTTGINLQTQIDIANSQVTDNNHFKIELDHTVYSVSDVIAVNANLHRNIEIGAWTIDDPTKFKNYMPYVTFITSNKIASNMLMPQISGDYSLT